MKEQKIELTDRQEYVYQSICDFINQNGYPPSISDIAHINYISRSVAQRYIDILEFKNYIKREKGISRSIVII